jgi:hypothetical protein
MASLYDAIFLIQLVVTVGIFLGKAWNVINGGKAYDYRMGIMLFVGYLLAWFAGMVVLAQKYDSLIYGTFHNLESKLMLVVFLFTFIEVILHLKDTAINPFRRAG